MRLGVLFFDRPPQGFVGASSIERLPVETAIVGAVKAFKEIHLATKNRFAHAGVKF